MNAAGKSYICFGSRSDRFKIVFLADCHVGNKAAEVERLTRDIQAIKDDPNCFVIGCGDYADYIGLGDKRFDPATIDPTMTVKDLGDLGAALTRKVRDLLLPIKHKIIGLAYGNHEDKYMAANQQQDLHSWLCTELATANLGYSALLDLSFCRVTGEGIKAPYLARKAPKHDGRGDVTTKRVFVHHGCSAATTAGGKLNSLVNFMKRFDADWYAIGHVHDQQARQMITIGADQYCRELREKKKLGVITGSYLKTYAQDMTSYGEKKGYDPVPLGATSIIYDPERDEAHAII